MVLIFIFVGVNTKEKHATCKKDYKIMLILRIWHAPGDLCKHLGIHLITDPEGMSVLYIYCKSPTLK